MKAGRWSGAVHQKWTISWVPLDLPRHMKLSKHHEAKEELIVQADIPSIADIEDRGSLNVLDNCLREDHILSTIIVVCS